jgi:copper chaperone CopZ
MKKLFLFISIVFASFAANAQFKTATLQAAGLTCAMCTKAINKSLDRLSFISKVEPDIKNSAFIITFKEGADVDFDALKKAVEDAGFSVARLKVTGTFNNLAIQNDAHVQLSGKTFHFLNISNQKLNGQQSVVFVDKDFVSDKEYKKYSAATKMSCVQTGKAASCCVKEGVPHNTRIYHVTI